MDNDFETIIKECFKIIPYTSNNKNISLQCSYISDIKDIFVGYQVNTECIICYTNVHCVKCVQCTAIYCCNCLYKMALTYNCICNLNIINNINQYKVINQSLILKAYNNFIKEEEESKNNAKILLKLKEQEKEKEKEKEKETKIKKLQNNDNKNSNNLKLNLLKDLTSNKIFNSNINKSNTQNSNVSTNLNTDYLKDLKDNKIYNIDFKSFINKVGNNIPNFDYLWDYNNKTLTFYVVPNNNNINNIVINYNILNATHQSEIYNRILNLLHLQFDDFKESWNKIATIMTQIEEHNITIMLRNITNICMKNTIQT
jgi:hypothetical protein